jgi:UDP-N-acetylmuramoyl-L-alanyl-D-glutamate--2,6-diaminopimelate ligase
MEEILQLLKGASDITDNSGEVKENSIFFAIRGTNADGHSFIGEVLKKKPLAVVVEKDYIPPAGLNFSKTKLVKVENTRRAFALTCREFYGRPDEKLKVFGVTGTNGKTSTTYILSSILNQLGYPSGIIGTVEYRFGDKVYGRGQTTPHPKVWFKTLNQMLKDGAKAVACEVSSHALDQFRIFGTTFEGIIFTNLSRDHLDYHRTMENYFLSKKGLFSDYNYKSALVNGDDPYGKRLKKEFNLKSYGFEETNDYGIAEGKSTLEGTFLKLRLPDGKKVELKSPLLGEFQIYNIAGAVSLLHSLDYPIEQITEAVKNLPQIPGRFEVLRRKPFLVVVDYAHTPDALEKLLISVKKLNPKRVITVFGAGGNRDKTKRPLMGKVAERYSDIVVLTSDNPRFEEPMEIISQILEGVGDRSKVYTIPDRREGIAFALKIAKEGDAVVIAGKGHEDYQEIKGKRYPFDDRKVVKEILNL